MKAGVSLYSFHSYTSANSLGIKKCIEKAKELGYSGIDFVEFGSFSSQKEYLAYASELGNFAREIGMETVCFCVGSDFLNGSGGNTSAEVERVKLIVEAAASLGCSVMRHDATRGMSSAIKTKRGFDDVLPRLADAYRAVTEYAQTFGVKTCVENHGYFVQDSARVEKLINAVGHPNFGALVDIGNFLCADERPEKAVGILAPYAFHAHAKDFHFKDGSLDAPGEGWFTTRAGNYLCGAVIGQGIVPVRKCVNVLRSAGYDGYLSVEFEGPEDPIKGIRIGRDNLRRIAGV